MPAPAEMTNPVEKGAIHLLETLSTRWEFVQWDRFTATQHQAIAMLTESGLVEQRFDTIASVSGKSETVRVLCSWCGGQSRKMGYKLLDIVNSEVATSWPDSDSGKISMKRLATHEIRLTDAGEKFLAKCDGVYEGPNLFLLFGTGPDRFGRQIAPFLLTVKETQIEPNPPATRTLADHHAINDSLYVNDSIDDQSEMPGLPPTAGSRRKTEDPSPQIDVPQNEKDIAATRWFQNNRMRAAEAGEELSTAIGFRIWNMWHFYGNKSPELPSACFYPQVSNKFYVFETVDAFREVVEQA